MVTPLSPADGARIAAAVAAAERTTDAEIVPIVSVRSDAYHDVVLHWALLAMLCAVAVAAVRPGWLVAVADRIGPGWSARASAGGIIAAALLLATLAFLAARIAIGATRLRYMLAPGATKARRVRHRAVDLFRVGVQARTARRDGVLLYLSIAERRAEIVADRRVHSAVPPERWGDLLALLLAQVRAGHVADGLIDAIAAIGGLLAEHVPPTAGSTAELPDRLIQL